MNQSVGRFPAQRHAMVCLVTFVLTLSSSIGSVALAEKDTQLKQLLEDHSDKIRPILVDLRTLTKKSIANALRKYNSIETKKALDLETRHKIHQWLVEELRGMRHPALADACRRVLVWTGRTSLPAQVVVLKTILGPKFPSPRDERLELLKRLATSKRGVVHRWAVHALEGARDPDAVDVLIDALETVQTGVGQNATVVDRLSLALYRLLGESAIDLEAKAIRHAWQALGRKLPRDPVYGKIKSGTTTYVAYFGDPVAAESVFLIDTSNSMKHKTTMRTAQKGAPAREDYKIDVARTELRRALTRMRDGYRFNVLAFDDAPRPWRGGTRARLQPATISNLNSAISFVATLRGKGGTNIRSALGIAADVKDVEVIYILSDGSPSEIGTSGRVARHVRMINYLAGVRVVALGLYNTDDDVYDERLMERLAQENWGWYRRLN